ncbi:MAG: hypothetical protein HYY18_18535 [Planctomycetes bacterium]|nr:hypothetical protein [Planctomycetota bacterium]
MRPLYPALLAALLSSAALADRMVPEAKERALRAPEPGKPAAPPIERDRPGITQIAPPEITTVAAPGGRVAAFGTGFLVLEGNVFVAYDREGKERRSVFTAPDAVSRWTLSPDQARVAFAAAEKVQIANLSTSEVTILGPEAAGPIRFDAAGRRLAWITITGRAVTIAADGTGRRDVLADAGMALGPDALLSFDGKRLFATARLGGAESPNAIVAATLESDARTFAKLYEPAAGVITGGLDLTPGGASIIFVQHTPGAKPESALRLLSADGADMRTLARAPAIDGFYASQDGTRVNFAARGAAGRFLLFECSLAPDPASGEIVTRRLAEIDGADCLAPAAGPDWTMVYLLVKRGEAPATVARVTHK